MELSRKIIKLNDGKKDISVLVYLKEITVRNKHKATRAFCKIIDD